MVCVALGCDRGCGAGSAGSSGGDGVRRTAPGVQTMDTLGVQVQ